MRLWPCYLRSVCRAFFVLVSICCTAAFAREGESARIFLDCAFCDDDFVRREIAFVDWVRDRADADVHVLVTTQRTASGGLSYQLAFLGDPGARSDTLRTTVEPNSTDHRRRTALVDVLKLGLIPHVLHTPQVRQLRIEQMESQEAPSTSPEDDPWDSWVFEIEGGVSLDREQQQREFDIDTDISADRITEDWRIRSFFWANYERETFQGDEGPLESNAHSNGAWMMAVKSLGPHWSAGVSSSMRADTYDNIQRRFQIEPAVEYSYWDYAEAERRELLFIYRTGPRYTTYIDTTIFNEIAEPHWRQEFEVRLNSTQPWGSADFDVEASHFLPDIERYRLEMRGHLSLRLFRGFSLNMHASFERINDQVNLARGDVSTEDLLLRRRELETDYRASFRVGLGYTFGSLYNNVINTRL
jgi:hypothetical protein